MEFFIVLTSYFHDTAIVYISLQPLLKRLQIDFVDVEIFRVGVVEGDGGDGGFRFHHVAFGQDDADAFCRYEQVEEGFLIFETRAGRVARANADAAIRRGAYSVSHNNNGWPWKRTRALRERNHAYFSHIPAAALDEFIPKPQNK